MVTERWHGVAYGDRPLARVREYVTLVKACLTGEKVDFDGDFYRVKGFRLGVRLGERRPKVVVGALNPAMLRLAGEVADGVLLNYLPASHVPWSVEQVRAGGDAEIYAYVHAGVGDREEGIDKARRDLFSYAVVDAYAAQLRPGRVRRRGRRDPRAPRRGRPRRRARRGVRPHVRRHRRHRRRRPRARHRPGLRRRRRRRARCSCRCRGAATAAGHQPTPAAAIR